MTRMWAGLVVAACAAALVGGEPPAAERVGSLIHQLGSKSFAEREAASRALGEIGEDAMSALIDAMKNSDAEIARRAGALVTDFRSKNAYQVHCMTGHRSTVECIAFSPSGRFILSGGRDNTVRLWETTTGKHVQMLEGHTEWVSQVWFSANENRAFSVGEDQMVHNWDLRAGTSLSKSNKMNRRRVSPDGRYTLNIDEDEIARLREIGTDKVIREYTGHRVSTKEPSGYRNLVHFLQDGRLAVTAGYGRALRLWDTTSAEEIQRFQGETSQVLNIWASVEGSWLIAEPSYGESVWLYEVRTGLCRKWNVRATVDAVGIGPEGKRFATARADVDGNNQFYGTVQVWDSMSGQEVCSFKGHHRAITRIAFAPDGRHVASASHDGTVRLWHLPR